MASARSVRNSTGTKPGDADTADFNVVGGFIGRVERIDAWSTVSVVATLLAGNNGQTAGLPTGNAGAMAVIEIYMSAVDPTDSDLFPAQGGVSGGGGTPTQAQLDAFFCKQLEHDPVSVTYEYDPSNPKVVEAVAVAAANQTFMVVQVIGDRTRTVLPLLGRCESYLFSTVLDTGTLEKSSASAQGDATAAKQDTINSSIQQLVACTSNDVVAVSLGSAVDVKTTGSDTVAVTNTDLATIAAAADNTVNTKLNSGINRLGDAIVRAGDSTGTGAGNPGAGELQVVTKASTGLGIKNVTADAAGAVIIKGLEANNEVNTVVSGNVAVVNPSAGTPLVVASNAKESNHLGSIAASSVTSGSLVPNSTIDMTNYRAVVLSMRWTYSGGVSNLPIQISAEMSNDSFANSYLRRYQGAYNTSGVAGDSFLGTQVAGAAHTSQIYQCMVIELDASMKEIRFRNTDTQTMSDLRIDYVQLP